MAVYSDCEVSVFSDGFENGDTSALEAVLPEGVRVLSAAGRSQATAAMTQAFMTNLTAMSLLALLVGVFLIFNSVSFSVLQRRHLIGVLRGLGITRKQVFAMILAETALLGVVASMLGVVLGVLLGEQLLALGDLFRRGGKGPLVLEHVPHLHLGDAEIACDFGLLRWH